MEPISCPWPAATQLAPHYCEENLCAWIVQPNNTWSNIGYLVVALLIFRNKSWGSHKNYFSLITFVLFIGSSLYHMTGTYWGRDIDVGAMLLLSAYILGLAGARLLNFNKKYLLVAVPIVFILSALNIQRNWGGKLFILQVISAALIEVYNSKNLNIHPKIINSLKLALGLFVVALILNLIDMNRIYCLPANSFITLHAIWHLICAYCLYLVAQYFCVSAQARP